MAFCVLSKGKAKEASMSRKEDTADRGGNHPDEVRGFQLDLPVKVSGRDASGRDFEEETLIGFMSHSGASFDLRNTVAQGTELRLVVSLPPKLSEDNALKLVIRGRVAYIERRRPESQASGVFLKLESRYVIKPETDEAAS
jgi:hypothetical protein